jgi:hypothetical protein
MTHSRREYEQIAEAFRRVKRLVPVNLSNDEKEVRDTTLGLLGAALADIFEHTNPRFDRKRFYEECGIKEIQ